MKKITDELIQKFQNSNSKKRKICSLLELNEKNNYNAELFELIIKLHKDTQYDPAHREYVIIQNAVSIFSEEITQYKEFRDFCKIVSDIEEEYMPSGPPWSPLTKSYYTFWIYFDYKINETGETIGSIFHDLGENLGFTKNLLRGVNFCNNSRMGLYKQIKTDDKYVILKELGSNENIRCLCPTKYIGKENAIWFVRILPNLIDINDYSIAVTTPYIIINYSEKDWLEYYKRNHIYIDGYYNEEAANKLLKYGLSDYYWNEYLMDAYCNYNTDHIRLTGIPDIKGSKPHERQIYR